MSEQDRQDRERSFLCSVPVRSPSPDVRNRNRILRTVSPSIQVRRQVAPTLRELRGYDTLVRDENEDGRTIIHDFQKEYSSSDLKRLRERVIEQDKLLSQLAVKSDLQNSRHSEELKQRLVQKDKIISDLKKVIATLSDRSQISISESRSEPDRIRVLEIENERLGEIVRKLNKKDVQEKLLQETKIFEEKIERLAEHNRQLEEKLVIANEEKLQEIGGMAQENDNLRERINQLLMVEERNRGLQNQNSRLLKLLSDKKPSLAETFSLQENQITRLQNELMLLKDRPAPQKLTLLKIREQYNESLRMFMEQVTRQVEAEFGKMQEVIEELQSRLVEIEPKIPQLLSIQKTVFDTPVKLAELSRSHLEETADLNTEIKKEREEKMELQEKFDRLFHSYGILVQNREQEERRYQENTLKSTRDLEILRKEVQLDRQKHYEELEIIRNAHESELSRLSYKHEEEVNNFKGVTSNEVSRVVDNFNQEISVLKGSLMVKNNDMERYQTELSHKEVEYRRNIQLVEERLRIESSEVARLMALLAEKESKIRFLFQNKQEIQDLGQVRKRSQTQTQLRYNNLELRYTELLGNYSEISEKYTQLLTRNNQLEDMRRKLEESARSLGLQNEMIPELKSRITNLDQQLLSLEEELQEKKIKYENLLTKHNIVNQEKEAMIRHLGSIKEKLVVFGSKTRTTVEKMSHLETQTALPGFQFFQILEQVSNRIVTLENSNAQHSGLKMREQENAEALNRELLSAHQEIVSLRAQYQELKNDLAYLHNKVELKDRELLDLRNLFETRKFASSQIYHSEIQQEVDLSDINKLRHHYQTLVDSLATTIGTLKQTMETEEVVIQ